MGAMSADKVEKKPGQGTPKKEMKSSGKRRKNERDPAVVQANFRSQIPWTEEETAHVKELLDYLTTQLKAYEGTDNQLPQEETNLLMSTLQQFLMQEELDRNDPLLSKIAYYFHDVQCVDLDKVARLLKHNKELGDTMRDQNVILLLGNPGSGKTTTLHCLAGTTFKESVVDGFVHLKPTQFLDATVAGYDTSFSRNSVTKTLQIAKVKVLDEEYIVCDTPVFGVFDSVEEEIANKNGLLDAICRARSIRPVFVLSQECLGNRMNCLPDVFETMKSYFHLQDTNTEVIPFQYVFTRFDDRHRTRLWKMFKYYRDSSPLYDGDDRELFEKVVNDLIEKTNPEANVVSPISDIPRYLLKRLLEDPALECGPRESLKDAGPNYSLNLLHVQLKLTLYGLMMFLACSDFEAAVEKVNHLSELADVLVTAKTYLDLALKACERYAIVLWESFNERMEKRDYMSALALISHSNQLSAALPDMDDYIQLSYAGFWQEFVDIETKKSKQLIEADAVLQLRDMAKLNPEVNAEILGGIRMIRAQIQKPLLGKAEDLGELVPHFMLLLQLGIGFPEAAKAASEMLDRLELRVMDRIKEMDYKKSTDDLNAVSKLTKTFPDRTRFAGYAVKMYKQALDQAIDKNYFENAGEVMFHLIQLNDGYNDAGKYAARGLDKLWKKFEYAIKQHEYATAISIIKHLSKVSNLSTTAFERSRLGIEVIRDRLFKSIENKNYGMAQVLMQQLTKLERMLPKEMIAKVKAKKAVENDPPKEHRRRERSQSPGYRPRLSGTTAGAQKHYHVSERGQDDHYDNSDDYERRRHRHRVDEDVYEERDDHEHRRYRHREAEDELEVRDDYERCRHRHRDQKGERREHAYAHRENLELVEDISELTMSVTELKKYHQAAHDVADFEAYKALATSALPPVPRLAVPYTKPKAKDGRDSSPKQNRYKYEFPPQRKSRGYDQAPTSSKPRYESPRKGRSASKTKVRADSPVPKLSHQPTNSRRHRYESPRKNRYDSPQRRKRHSSPQQPRKSRHAAAPPAPRQSNKLQSEAKKWFHTSKNKHAHYEEYDAYDEYSSLPAVGDDDYDESSFDKKHSRNPYRRNSRHSRRSFDTPMEASMYRKERLRRVEPSNSSEETGSSWDI